MHTYSLPGWYKTARREVERYFSPSNRLDKVTQVTSPCGRYQLEIERYRTIQGGSDYSRGILTDLTTKQRLADIKRSAADFWYCWVSQGDKMFLVCAEDPQGYTIVDIDAKTTYSYIDPKARSGFGFEWLDVKPSPDGKYLAVQGNYMDTDKYTVLYDFKCPTRLPLLKLRALEIRGSARMRGWIGDCVQLQDGNEISIYDTEPNK